ncbi:hypothetical protein [Humibacter ginsengisoli]
MIEIPSDRRIKPLLDELEAQGWRIDPKTKGWMCFPPDKSKRPVAIHKTPSDHRWYENCLSALRKSGFQGFK